MVMVIVSIGAPLSLDCSVVTIGPVLRQNSVRRHVIDLSAPVARRSRLNGHPPAPAAPLTAVADVAHVPDQSRPGPRRHRPTRTAGLPSCLQSPKRSLACRESIGGRPLSG